MSEFDGAQGVRNNAPVWYELSQNNNVNKETEQDKLKKTSVWDYAANAQAYGAYAG